MTLDELIKKLESAQEGSRELDHAVASAFGRSPDYGLEETCPRFSRSLDAALSLVPEGWTVDLRICGYEVWTFAKLIEAQTGNPVYTGHKKTAPLALCIASLKARSSQQGEIG